MDTNPGERWKYTVIESRLLPYRESDDAAWNRLRDGMRFALIDYGYGPSLRGAKGGLDLHPARSRDWGTWDWPGDGSEFRFGRVRVIRSTYPLDDGAALYDEYTDEVGGRVRLRLTLGTRGDHTRVANALYRKFPTLLRPRHHDPQAPLGGPTRAYRLWWQSHEKDVGCPVPELP